MLTTGTIDQTIREAGRPALPLEEVLAVEIQQAPLLHVDETPWKEAGVLLWLWTLVSTTTVLFVIGYCHAGLADAGQPAGYDTVPVVVRW